MKWIVLSLAGENDDDGEKGEKMNGRLHIPAIKKSASITDRVEALKKRQARILSGVENWRGSNWVP